LRLFEGLLLGLSSKLGLDDIGDSSTVSARGEKVRRLRWWCGSSDLLLLVLSPLPLFTEGSRDKVTGPLLGKSARS